MKLNDKLFGNETWEDEPPLLTKELDDLSRQKLNIQVPSELGIVAFDNYPLAEYTDPPLTIVDIDTGMLGDQTAQLLFRRIDKRSSNQQIMLSTNLIIRKSSERTAK